MPFIVQARLQAGQRLVYTVDGQEPQASAWPLTGVVLLTDSTDVRVGVIAADGRLLHQVQGSYRLSAILSTQRPVAAPPGGEYAGPQRVTLSCPTMGAAIRYTLDGSEPTLASRLYSAPVSIDADTTLRARAFGGRLPLRIGRWAVLVPAVFPSGVLTARYVIRSANDQVAVPSVSPAAGTYRASFAAMASSATAGAELRYRLDAQEPTESDPLLPPAGVAVERSTAFAVRGFKAGWTPSAVSRAAYVLRVPEPTVDPPSGLARGEFMASVSVPDGATVRYTLDGRDPNVDSPVVDGPLLVDRNLQIRLQAERPGWEKSSVVTVAYSLQPLSPTVSLPAGSYVGFQTAVLGVTTPGAAVLYTLDGSDPASSGTARVVNGPVPITASVTIKAIARRAGWLDSAMISASYIIDAPPTIAAGPAADHNPVLGVAARLRVEASDDGGLATLVTEWSATGPAPVQFTADGNVQVQAVFSAAGSYEIQVLVRDTAGQVASASSPIMVLATPAAVRVDPDAATLVPGGTITLAATLLDQFGTPIADHPAAAWSIVPETAGTVVDGAVVASRQANGAVEVTASVAGVQGRAALQVRRPRVSFAPALPAVVAEADASLATTLKLDGPAAYPVAITYAISGTADAGDHDLVGGSVEIAAGALTVEIPGRIRDDQVTEDDESLVVTITAVSDADLEGEASHSFTIIDNDLPVLAWSRADAVLLESEDALVLTAQLDRASPRPIDVPYSVGGNAPFVRHGLRDGVLRFAPGQIKATLVVVPVQDAESQEDQIVSVSLAPPASVIAGTPIVQAITLVDDDTMPTVSFATSLTTCDESDGRAVAMLRLSRPASRPLSVTVGVTGGSAQVPQDASLVLAYIAIPTGASQAEVQLSIMDDTLVEPDEDVVIGILGGLAITDGGIRQHRVAIGSDDHSQLMLAWNRLTLQLITLRNIDPPMASRLLALRSIAADRAFRQGAGLGGAIAASHEVLTRLFPADHSVIDAELSRQQAAEPGQLTDAVLAAGSAGRLVGGSIVQVAASDGSSDSTPVEPPQGDGIWHSSWSWPQPALRPRWGAVRTWFIGDMDAIRPPAPPAWGSPAFKAALAEVRAVADNRTEEQLQIAARWSDGPGTPTPPGRWNLIADGLIDEARLDEEATAHLLAMLNAAIMDAGIATWEAKYRYWLIRPYQADAAISTPIGQPNFPSYTSGHGGFSGAASEVLAAAFPTAANVLRAQAEEAALSRLLGGIHYRFDNDQGLALGRRIAALALADDADGVWDRIAAPQIAITAPAHGAVIDGAVEIRAAVHDDGPLTVDGISASLEGAAGLLAGDLVVQPLPGSLGLGVVLTPTASLQTGVYLARIVARDADGRVSEARVSFAVDHDGVPKPVVTAPADWASIGRSDAVVVSGYVDQPITMAQINGMPAVISTDDQGRPTFAVTFAVTDDRTSHRPGYLVTGENWLTVRVWDAAGRAGTVIHHLNVDGDAPSVTLESPADNSEVGQTTVVLAGQVQDIVIGTVNRPEVAVTVSVNGGPVRDAAVINRSWSLPDVVLVEGRNEIALTATDVAGNIGRASAVINRAAPRGTIVSIVQGDGQTAAAGTRLPQDLRVRLAEPDGSAVPDVLVRFEVSRGDGTLIGSQDDGGRILVVRSGADGTASAALMLGGRSGVGVHRVRATTAGSAVAVEFTASATHGAAVRLAPADGDQQTAAIGTWLPDPFDVLALDGAGNAVPHAVVRFDIVSGAGLLAAGREGAEASEGLDITADDSGRARCWLRLGPTAGFGVNVISASIPGATLSLGASGLVVGDPAETAFAGVVLDTSRNPVAGVTVVVDGSTIGAVTAADGSFRIAGVPPGRRHVTVNGTTASSTVVRYPMIGYEVDLIPGAVNRLPMPIYLPQMDISGETLVGGATDVELAMPGLPGWTVTILANSTYRADGVRAPLRMYTSPVNPLSVPMAPPYGALPPVFATLQPGGIRLDPPARLTMPNLDGLPPGAQSEIIGFDHDLGEFVAYGTATVSEDGLRLVSDAGSGIPKSGWYGNAQPIPTADVDVPIPPVPGPDDDPDDDPEPKPSSSLALAGPTEAMIGDVVQFRAIVTGPIALADVQAVVPVPVTATPFEREPNGEGVTDLRVVFVYDLAPDQAPPTGPVQAQVTAHAGRHEKTVGITLLPPPAVDLDVDCDNNNGLELPSRTTTEEMLEDAVGAPGKLALIARGDADGDGIGDAFDGFTIPGSAQGGDGASPRFIPLVLSLRGEDLSTRNVSFTYPASDPMAIVVPGGEGEEYHLPAVGHLRLWLVDGDRKRDPRPVSAGGDFIPAGTCTVADLGLPSNGGTVTIYVEAVATSAVLGSIMVNLDAAESGAVPVPDSVMVTAIDIQAEDVAVTSGQWVDVNPVQILGAPEGVNGDLVRRAIFADLRLVAPDTVGSDPPAHILRSGSSSLSPLQSHPSGGYRWPGESTSTIRILGGLVEDGGMVAPFVPGSQTVSFEVISAALPVRAGDEPDIGEIAVTAPAMHLVSRHDGFYPAPPFGSPSIYGGQGDVVIDAALPIADTMRYGLEVVKLGDTESVSVLSKTSEGATTTITVAGLSPGGSILLFKAFIGTGFRTLLRIPVQVDLPVVVAPQNWQLAEYLDNVRNARLAAKDADIAWAQPPLPEAAAPGTFRSAAPQAETPTIEALEEQALTNLAMAAQILPNNDAAGDWYTPYQQTNIMPFAGAVGDENLLTASEIAAYIARLDLTTPPAPRILRSQLATSGFGFSIWQRLTHRVWNAGEPPSAKPLSQVDQQAANHLLVVARKALEDAALARLKQYFALGTDYKPLVAAAADAASGQEWPGRDDRDEDVEDVIEKAYADLLGQVQAAAPERFQVTPAIRLRVDRTFWEWLKDFTRYDTPIERFFRTPRTPSWNIGHPYTVEVLSFMLQERLEVLKVAVAELDSAPRDENWPLRVYMGIVSGESYPVEIHLTETGVVLRAVGGASGEANPLANGWSTDMVVTLPNGEQKDGDLSLRGLDVARPTRVQALGWTAVLALDEAMILQGLLDARYSAAFWKRFRDGSPFSFALMTVGDVVFSTENFYAMVWGKDLVSGETLSLGARLGAVALFAVDVVDPGFFLKGAGKLVKLGKEYTGSATRAIADRLPPGSIKEAIESSIERGEKAITEVVDSARRGGKIAQIGLDGMRKGLSVVAGAGARAATVAAHTSTGALNQVVGLMRGAMPVGLQSAWKSTRELMSPGQLATLPRSSQALRRQYLDEVLGVQQAYLPDGTVMTPDLLAKLPECWSTSCFPAGTPVVLADGSTLPIEQVRGGMLLMTRDQDRPEAGTWAGVVTQTFRREVDHLLRVHLADGGSIDCTDEHPFYAVDRGWTGSGSLRPGDRVLAGLATGSEHDTVGVERVERIAGGVVYNFEVATDHTYFVQGHGGTEVPVWVHNLCKFGSFKSIVGVDGLSRSLLGLPAGTVLTDAQYRQAMELWISKTGANKNRGRIIVSEPKSIPRNDDEIRALAYENQSRQGTIYELDGFGSNENGRLTPALAFDNPNGRGAPFVRFDNFEEGTNTFIDRKYSIRGQSKTKNQIVRWKQALDDNEGFFVRVEVPNASAQKAMEKQIRDALGRLDSRIEVVVKP